MGERLCEPTDADTAASICCPTVFDVDDELTLGIVLLPTTTEGVTLDVLAAEDNGPAEVLTMAGSWMSEGGS